jgi:hypothetical protein
VGFCANVTALIKGPHGFVHIRSLSGELVGFVVGYVFIVLVLALVRPGQVLVFNVPTFLPLFFLAPLVGIACIGLEYLVGVLLLFLRTRKLVTRVTVHSSYSAFAHIASIDVVSILAFVVGEELIVRQFLYNLLATDFAITLWIVIVVCTVVFSLNHLSFGTASAISKLPSGFVYVMLFYLSGLSIGVVIVAHATQNLALLALSRTKA